jgi:hypothetical protein
MSRCGHVLFAVEDTRGLNACLILCMPHWSWRSFVANKILLLENSLAVHKFVCRQS